MRHAIASPAVAAAWVGLAAALAAAGCGRFGRSLPADFSRGGLQLDYGVAPGPETVGREAALARSAGAVITRRIVALKLCQPDVKAVGREVRVGLPAACGPAVPRIRKLLAVGGRLELRETDDGEALAPLAAALPPGTGLALATDRWTDPHGGEAHARVLEGPVDALERFRGGLAPGALPAGVDALIEAPAAGRARARLYLVRGDAEVTGEQIREVQVRSDEQTDRPYLAITLDATGAARFEALTRRLIGRKLAIVLDRRIMSAPVVMSAITGGRAMITLGGAGSPQAQRRDAEDLALALGAGALPARLELLREHAISPAR